MKIRLAVSLVGLAISFALPTFAQQKDTADPQLREKLVAAIKKHTDALDKNDAAAIAANFTEDAVLVTQDGPFFGREAIEKHYVDDFSQQIHLSNNTTIPSRPIRIPHTLWERPAMRCGRPEVRPFSESGKIRTRVKSFAKRRAKVGLQIAVEPEL